MFYFLLTIAKTFLLGYFSLNILSEHFKAVIPNLFDTRDQSAKTIFLRTEVGGGGAFATIQVLYIQAHLLLCGPVPNRPGLIPVPSLEVGDPCFKEFKE